MTTVSNDPRITIIMPVWNGLPYIREAIESVINQNFSNWELLVSDNGSTDGTREYLTSLQDPRIRTFLQETNLGIFGNLNFLFSQARAPLSYILCADDYLLPGGLELIFQEWELKDPGIALLRFNWNEGRHGKGKRISYHLMPTRIEPEESDYYFYLFGCAQGNLSNVSLRTALVAELGEFNVNLPYAGDYEFWTRLGRKYPWAFVRKEVTYVRRHEGVASNYLNKNGELIRQSIQVRLSLYDRLVSRYPVWLLRLHGSWRYLPMIEIGVRQLAGSRRTTALRNVARYIRQGGHLHPFLTCLLYVASLGGRLGRHVSTNMLHRYHERKIAGDSHGPDQGEISRGGKSLAGQAYK